MREVWRIEPEDIKNSLNKNKIIAEYGRVKLRHNAFQNIYIIDMGDSQHQNIVFNYNQYIVAIECFNKKIYEIYNIS
tara:strand:+ start:3097 stop:3327 length:231 start_codon:yes stop_codon:yes gene_type:complete